MESFGGFLAMAHADLYGSQRGQKSSQPVTLSCGKLERILIEAFARFMGIVHGALEAPESEAEALKRMLALDQRFAQCIQGQIMMRGTWAWRHADSLARAAILREVLADGAELLLHV